MSVQTQKQIEARQENEALRAIACLYSVLRRGGMDRGPYMSDLYRVRDGIFVEISERREKRKAEK